MGTSKNTANSFSQYVESYMKVEGFDSISEAIISIIEENIFDYIGYHNVHKFISFNLKEKLMLEYSKNNMLKDKYKIKNIELF